MWKQLIENFHTKSAFLACIKKCNSIYSLKKKNCLLKLTAHLQPT